MEASLPRAQWRLIRSPAASGSWNMALDEAILEFAGRGDVLPTLRLYTWQPPCLSLGIAQPVGDISRQALEAMGWEVVRRPTGGRAILHTDELTYSVAGPYSDPRLAGGILESYRVLALALLGALHILGIPAKALEKPQETAAAQNNLQSGQAQNPVCFEMPSNYEITTGGKKLLGSAQARRKEGVLQHGSLPLCGDLRRITQALAFPDAGARASAAERLARRATTVEEVLGSAPSLDIVQEAFETAFSQSLNITLQPGVPAQAELARAQQLMQEKYANRSWIERV